jgi:exosortase/archaeosortase family protein
MFFADADPVLAFTVGLIILSATPRILGYYQFGVTQTERSFVLNAGELLAFFAVFTIVQPRPARIKLSDCDLAVLAGCSLLFVPPYPQNLPFLGASLAGIYIYWRGGDARLKSVGQIWLALSMCEVWGRVVFRIVAVPTLRAESILVAKAGNLLGLGLSIDGVLIRTPGGWSMYLLDACSSFHNLSLAFLVWLSLLKLSEAQANLSKVVALVIGMVAVVGLNTVRLLLMTRSEASYQYWHQGDGQVVYSIVALLAIALPTLALLRSNQT